MKVTIEQIKEHFANGGEICAPFSYYQSNGIKDWHYVEVKQKDLIDSMKGNKGKELIIDDTDLSTINWFIVNED